MSGRRIVLVDIGEGLTLSGILPSVALQDSYSARLVARGGVAPYTFVLAGGALPDGLMLDAATGVINGTASAGGAFGFAVRVTDISGATSKKSFTIQVAQPVAPPLVISGTYPNGTVGVAYSAELTISGGVTPYSNARVTSGALPAGLALSIVGNKLRLSGAAATAASTSFTAAVSSADGQSAASAQAVTFDNDNTVSLLHFDGVDGSTQIIDARGKVWTATNAAITTAESQFGSGCLRLGVVNNSYISSPESTDYDFGSGDFTIEGWIVTPSPAISHVDGVWDGSISSKRSWVVYASATQFIFQYSKFGSDRIDAINSAVPISRKTHYAISCNNGLIRGYLNGVQVGATHTRQNPIFWPGSGTYRTIGLQPTQNYGQMVGSVDEMRITKGLGRYPTPFTVPTSPFT